MTVSDLPPFNFAGRGVSSEIDGNLRLRSSAAGQGNLVCDGSCTVSGGLLGSNAILSQYTEPAGTLASTMPRYLTSATSGTPTSGTVYAFAIPVEAGKLITNVNLFSIAAEATGTHAWAGIADNTRTVLAISADNVGAAFFAANTATVVPLAAPLLTTRTGLYYVFYCVVAGTMPTFAAAPALANSALSAVAPVVCGSTLTGQTTPVAVSSSLGAITALAAHNDYCWLT